MMAKIFVVGSINTDIVINVEKVKTGAETLIDGDIPMSLGGKGADQAAICGLLGGKVYLFGAVGADIYGSLHTKELKSRGVNVDFLQTQGAATGTVIISKIVGVKYIINYTGANYKIEFGDIERGLHKLAAKGDFLILQQEIQNEITEKVIDLGYDLGLRIVLNPAPASLLREDIYKKIEFLIPNETEYKILTGEDLYAPAIRKLLKMGVKNVIITLGENGVAFSNTDGSGSAINVPAIKINAVDEAGAGDAFIGSFITQINNGEKFKDAVAFAQKVAAVVCTRKGTYQNFPTLQEINEL
jgi:ribokinase